MVETLAENVSNNDANSEAQQSENSESVIKNGHVLIVSHGLLLRELKLVIAQRFSGELDESMSAEIKKISPNTGRSQFVVQACKDDKKLHIKCLSINVLNDNSHLTEGGNTLATHFKGAL